MSPLTVRHNKAGLGKKGEELGRKLSNTADNKTAQFK